MGKRLRSIAVQYDDLDIQVTRHAIDRFCKRVAKARLPTHVVIGEIRRLLKAVVPVAAGRGETSVVYLKHQSCTLVMTRRGVILTVLPPESEDSHRFASDVKEIRKRKRQKRK